MVIFVFENKKEYNDCVSGRGIPTPRSGYHKWERSTCSIRDESPIGHRPQLVMTHRARRYLIRAHEQYSNIYLVAAL